MPTLAKNRTNKKPTHQVTERQQIERELRTHPRLLTERELEMGIACPLDHTPNAETAAAIEEGRAILRGEIPSKKYTSLEDFFKDLYSE
jgi:hypothetical protein